MTNQYYQYKKDVLEEVEDDLFLEVVQMLEGLAHNSLDKHIDSFLLDVNETY